MREIKVIDAGLVPYAVADEWQKDLHTRRVEQKISDVVLLVEHPHVYTLGRGFKPQHLLTGRDELSRRSIEVCEADRGGSITYHGPGQLVVYPIVDLNRPGKDFPDALKYLRTLEEAIIRTARSVGVVSTRREGMTGVWVGDAKLASIGVNISRGVSKHGLAMNVCTDLEFFSGMVPCGMPGSVTSLEAILNSGLTVSGVGLQLVKHLGQLLHARPVPSTLKDLDLAFPSDDQGPNIIEFPKSGRRQRQRGTGTASRNG